MKKKKKAVPRELPKNIVDVTFDFDLQAPEYNGSSTYTYFYRGKVSVGDLAVVNGPYGGLMVVLVVNTEPESKSILRATKSLIGLVDMGPYHAEKAEAAKREALNRATALKEAWGENYTGEH